MLMLADQAIELSWGRVSLAGMMLLTAGMLSVLMKVGLERTILVAGLRMVIQLSAAGLILDSVFQLRQPWAVAGLILIMTTIAGLGAWQRSRGRYPGMFAQVTASLGLAGFTVGMIVLIVVVQVHPWWTPQYAIPLFGMILGNSLDGVSLGMDRLTDTFRRDQRLIELRLSLGAQRSEAAYPILREAFRTGMTPILNSMSMIGLVSIPGMMTGQILAGADPISAVKYQIMIMFVIATAAALGTMLASWLGYRSLLTADHRLDLARLTQRKSARES